jgi:hypothetical protein
MNAIGTIDLKPHKEFRYAVVVDTRETTNTCFIACPFNKAVDKLSQSIRDAAIAVGLKPFQTNITRENFDFLDDVIFGIRKAKLFVAVLVSDCACGSFNPNVMYELGMAHAIGTPTIIVIDNGKKLPADVSHFQANFINRDEKEESILDCIKAAMWETLNRLQQNDCILLIDPYWAKSGIIKIPTTDIRRLRPEYWYSYSTLLNHAQLVNQNFNSLLFDVGELLTKAQQALQGIQVPNKERIWDSQKYFRHYLRDYEGHCWEINNCTLNYWEEHLRDSTKAFADLKQCVENDMSSKDISSSEEFYKNSIAAIETFRSYNWKFKDSPFDPNTLSNLVSVKDLIIQLFQLKMQIESIVTQSDGMMKNLIAALGSIPNRGDDIQ